MSVSKTRELSGVHVAQFVQRLEYQGSRPEQGCATRFLVVVCAACLDQLRPPRFGFTLRASFGKATLDANRLLNTGSAFPWPSQHSGHCHAACDPLSPFL